MKLKKGRLEGCRLYLILDKKVCRHRSLVNITKAIKDQGPNIIQFRDKESKKADILKNACRLRKLLLNTPNIFIINDYLDMAKIIDSDGIHLGQYDSSVQIARKILGKDKVIGVSCHNLSQVQKAQANGADYISIGPIFTTPTKPQAKAIGLNLLKEIAENIKIPFFVIGGINENNIGRVVSSGAKRVAICRAICQSKNIPQTIKHFQEILEKYPFNADMRRCNADSRRFYQRDNLRPSACNPRESAFKRLFQNSLQGILDNDTIRIR